MPKTPGFVEKQARSEPNLSNTKMPIGKPANRLSHVPSNRKPTQMPLLVTGKAIVQSHSIQYICMRGEKNILFWHFQGVDLQNVMDSNPGLKINDIDLTAFDCDNLGFTTTINPEEIEIVQEMASNETEWVMKKVLLSVAKSSINTMCIKWVRPCKDL